MTYKPGGNPFPFKQARKNAMTKEPLFIISGEQLDRALAYRVRVLPFMQPNERGEWERFIASCRSRPYNAEQEKQAAINGVLEKIKEIEEWAATQYAGAIKDKHRISQNCEQGTWPEDLNPDIHSGHAQGRAFIAGFVQKKLQELHQQSGEQQRGRGE